jgi:hypothetical protein
MPVPDAHFVNGAPLKGPFPAGLEQAVFGLGCFWGAERKFWQLPGVYTTAVGYAGGYTRIRRIRRCAPVRPAMPRSCWSCSIPRRSATPIS